MAALKSIVEARWPHGLRSSPDRTVWVRAIARDIAVLSSWVRLLPLTVPLSTYVYKWVPAYLVLGVTLGWTSIVSRREYSGNTPTVIFHATEAGTSSNQLATKKNRKIVCVGARCFTLDG